MKRKKRGRRGVQKQRDTPHPHPPALGSIEDIARAERSVVDWCAMKVQLHFVQALVVLALCCTANCTLERQMEERSASVASVERMRATFVGKNSGATKLLQRKKGMKYKGSSARVDGELEKQEATRSDEEKSSEADAQARREIPQEEQIQSRRLRRSGNRINQMVRNKQGRRRRFRKSRVRNKKTVEEKNLNKVVGDDFVNLR